VKTQSPDKSKKESKPVLWVVSELYYPEMTSTGYYLTKIAEGLAPEFDVKAICGQPNYSSRGITAPKKERLNGVEIFRVFGTRLNKNVIPFRILNMLTLGLSVFLRSIYSIRSDERVLVVTTPPLLPFLTAVACRIRGARHILLIHDCYPEILYAAGKLRKESVFARLLEYLSKRLLVSAERIIVVGRDMRDEIIKKTGPLTKCYVIPNWAELESVSPANRDENAMLLETGLGDKLVLLYAGNIGYPNDIETIIEAASIIGETDDGIHFIFLGDGVKKPLLVNSVKTKRLRGITLLDPKPRSEQQVFLNGCDVGIVSLVPKMKGVSMPSRTYNILAAGKPILALCERDSEIAKVVEEENVGWSIEPGNPEKLVEVLREIASSRQQLDQFGKNARNAAVKKYGLKTAVSAYRRVLS